MTIKFKPSEEVIVSRMRGTVSFDTSFDGTLEEAQQWMEEWLDQLTDGDTKAGKLVHDIEFIVNTPKKKKTKK